MGPKSSQIASARRIRSIWRIWGNLRIEIESWFQTEISKFWSFLEPQNFGLPGLRKFWNRVLDVVWQHPRYWKGPPRSHLSSAQRITSIRHVKVSNFENWKNWNSLGGVLSENFEISENLKFVDAKFRISSLLQNRFYTRFDTTNRIYDNFGTT